MECDEMMDDITLNAINVYNGLRRDTDKTLYIITVYNRFRKGDDLRYKS